MEERIGRVTHYYSRLGVAAIQVEHGRLHRGERLHIVGHTTDTEQVVDSLELDHQPIEEATAGQNVAIRVDDHVREHDEVYRAYI